MEYLWHWKKNLTKQKPFWCWIKYIKAIKLKIFLFCFISSSFQWEPGTKLVSIPQYCINLAHGLGFLFLAFQSLFSIWFFFPKLFSMIMKAQKFLVWVSRELKFSNHPALGTPHLTRTLSMRRISKISGKTWTRCVAFLYQESWNFAFFAKIQSPA